ncbi:hypothetical protein ENUP19_0062G0037 [Entamoeba nuttalli]|uniref:Uncharacterized protein n=2 Tax=Entamoeba nuttalli TaxID=412467 RepID=K2HQW9_ENTNP|nr:hypothetical protein ENU1_169100 [Entamoeba nuttalli P19]EKE38360.1 hypothetical protein ENU1_169100 [Entamoeba nuttalli P19]|eukprot:XP_008859309.1 hypothetical protein ENU1_169100 [Entamoeba nuttalli P19]
MLTYNRFYEVTNPITFPFGVSFRPFECEPPFPCGEVIDKKPFQCNKCGAYDNCFNLRVNGEFLCCVCGAMNPTFITYKNFTSNSLVVCPSMCQPTNFFFNNNKPKLQISIETIVVIFMQPKEADNCVKECLKELWKRVQKKHIKRKLLIVVENDEGIHLGSFKGNQIHLITIPQEEIIEDNFCLNEMINENTFRFEETVDELSFDNIIDTMLTFNNRIHESEQCYELLRQINTFESDMRICLFSGEIVRETIQIDIEQVRYKFPIHFILFSSYCSEIIKINKIIEQTGGSLHIWNINQQHLDICYRDLFDRLLCVRTRGGNKLLFFSHNSIKANFHNEFFQPNEPMPSLNPFTYFHFILSFNKAISLNYFQVVFTDVFLKDGKATPFTRIETIKVGHTKDTFKFFDNYPPALALSTCMQFNKDDMLKILPNMIRYYQPIQTHPLFKLLAQILHIVSVSALYSPDPLMSSLSHYLLIQHSPQYSMAIFNPPIIIYPTLQSLQQKPTITPSLQELIKMSPDLVLYPSQRLLLVLYNPRIIKNQDIPLRENIKHITHILAAIDSFKRLSYERPQRYIIYDFLLTDPILTKYIH